MRRVGRVAGGNLLHRVQTPAFVISLVGLGVAGYGTARHYTVWFGEARFGRARCDAAG